MTLAGETVKKGPCDKVECEEADECCWVRLRGAVGRTGVGWSRMLKRPGTLPRGCLQSRVSVVGTFA